MGQPTETAEVAVVEFGAIYFVHGCNPSELCGRLLEASCFSILDR